MKGLLERIRRIMLGLRKVSNEDANEITVIGFKKGSAGQEMVLIDLSNLYVNRLIVKDYIEAQLGFSNDMLFKDGEYNIGPDARQANFILDAGYGNITESYTIGDIIQLKNSTTGDTYLLEIDALTWNFTNTVIGFETGKPNGFYRDAEFDKLGDDGQDKTLYFKAVGTELIS